MRVRICASASVCGGVGECVCVGVRVREKERAKKTKNSFRRLL